MTESIYAKAINLVYYSSKEELAAIAVEVAKNNPSVFLRGHESTQQQQQLVSLDERLIALISVGEPIKAIKLHREVTGSTLADSKRVIDKLREQLASSGHG